MLDIGFHLYKKIESMCCNMKKTDSESNAKNRPNYDVTSTIILLRL